MNGGDGDGLQKTPLTALAVLYPPEALASHIEGDVLLSGVIDKDGNMRNVKVISGHPVLAVAAMNTVMQWQYKPYTF
jgi:bla regulator protein blaR1